MRWGGGVEEVYQEVLKLMREDFQSKWTHMKENVVDIEDGIIVNTSYSTSASSLLR